MTGLLDDIVREATRLPQGTRRDNPPAAPARGTGEDMARSVPPGLARGLSAAGGFPIDIINHLLSGSAWLSNRALGRDDTPAQIPIGRAEDYRRLIDSGMAAIGADGVTNYRPQTLPGRMVEQAGEFGVPAILAPGAGLARGLGSLPGMARMGGVWAGAGAAQEAAGTGARELGVPPAMEAALRAAIAASLGLGGMHSMARNTNAARMVRERMQGISPQQLDDAGNLQQTSRDIGVPLVGGEALGQAGSRVQQLASDVMQSPQASALPRALEGRRAAVQNAVRDMGEQMSPGPLPPVAGIVDEVSRGARDVIQNARRERTAATSPDYRSAAGDPVDPNLISPLLRDLDREIAASGGRTALGGAVQEYRQAITPRANEPFNLGPVAQVQRETARGLYPGQSGAPRQGLPGLLDTQQRGVIGPVNQQLRDILEATNPTFARAQQNYRAMSPAVEELRSPGLLGALQKAVPETGSVPAAFNRQFGAIAPADATMTSPDVIARLFGEMRATAPNALPTLARQGLLGRLEQAGARGPIGASDPTIGARLAKLTVGPPGSQANENWRAVMSGIENSRNLPAGQLQTGFQNLMDVLRQTASIPGVGSPTNRRAMTAMEASRSPGATVMETANVMQGSLFAPLARQMRAMANAGTNRVLDRVLADPNNIERLRQLATLPIGSTRWQRAAVQIINTSTAIETGLNGQQE